MVHLPPFHLAVPEAHLFAAPSRPNALGRIDNRNGSKPRRDRFLP
ncbi:hypothetical protein FHS54_002512 [Sphingobium vermicomposti]|uniref:Uncharacterized protein n=1 Tax=Sphingobium vermicomposti TaxID=529005 RepID=A0A846M7U3_9SPHN|nr:hypothetical protein [Sphingobium vermicomposti]